MPVHREFLLPNTQLVRYMYAAPLADSGGYYRFLVQIIDIYFGDRGWVAGNCPAEMQEVGSVPAGQMFVNCKYLAWV